MYDRAMQALYKLALAPVAETTADRNSYGFREGRGCADAIAAAFNALSKPNSATYILEGDIQRCFDNISKEWMLNHIPMDKAVLRSWLEAGYVENGITYPTHKGTPQGGVISPTLSNMTLDGLEQVVHSVVRAAQQGLPLKCLSRMMGNYHVRFLGGKRGASPSPYPVLDFDRKSSDHIDSPTSLFVGVRAPGGCTRDEGGPLGVGLQEQASNRLKLQG